jgi:hypothetical protein
VLRQREQPPDDRVAGGLIPGEFEQQEETSLGGLAELEPIDLRLHEQ